MISRRSALAGFAGVLASPFALGAPAPKGVKRAVNYDPFPLFMWAIAEHESGPGRRGTLLRTDRRAALTLNRWDVNGYAYGPFQIHYDYWLDAQRDSKLRKKWPGRFEPNGIDYRGSTACRWEDCRTAEGDWAYYYSEEVVHAYMRRYANAAYYADPDVSVGKWQVLARIHNGGPNGMQKDSTLPYWESVRALLIRQGWSEARQRGVRPPKE